MCFGSVLISSATAQRFGAVLISSATAKRCGAVLISSTTAKHCGAVCRSNCGFELTCSCLPRLFKWAELSVSWREVFILLGIWTLHKESEWNFRPNLQSLVLLLVLLCSLYLLLTVVSAWNRQVFLQEIYGPFSPRMNVSPSSDWQIAISQSAIANETHHPFDRHSYSTIQNPLLSVNSGP